MKLNQEFQHIRRVFEAGRLSNSIFRSRVDDDARRSISTAFVVRDMESIVDALGENGGQIYYWGLSYGKASSGNGMGGALADQITRLQARSSADTLLQCDLTKSRG